ncbi:MAG: PH domain-containing protein [Micromonosporaceae bacterium]
MTEPSGPQQPRSAVPPDAGEGSAPAPATLSWRVPGGLVILKVIATIGFGVAALWLASDPPGLALAVVATIAIGLYALRDLLAPVRLTADAEGVTVVTGYAGRRTIPWRDVERIRVDERGRLLNRSALLEIDTGESLHFFGTSELGQPVADVAEALRHLRTGR